MFTSPEVGVSVGFGASDPPEQATSRVDARTTIPKTIFFMSVIIFLFDMRCFFFFNRRFDSQ
jgi:hypothetical protein